MKNKASRGEAMNWSNRLFVVVGTLALAFGLCGCGFTATSSGGTGGGSVHRNEDGVSYSYATRYLTRNDRIYLFLVAARGTGTGSGGGGRKVEGNLRYMGGTEIDWSCATQDGESGKVTIDGQEFDLTAGALFLVSTKDKTAHVQQLKTDPAQLETCKAATKFLDVMKANPQMADFLELCKASE